MLLYISEGWCKVRYSGKSSIVVPIENGRESGVIIAFSVYCTGKLQIHIISGIVNQHNKPYMSPRIEVVNRCRRKES